MEQKQINNSIASLTKAYSDFHALKIRLDTTQLLDQIAAYLRGTTQIVEQDKHGAIKTRTEVTGVPKANPHGIQSIINWISATTNTQTVQGNFPIDKHGVSQRYDSYIEEYHIELTELLVVNCYHWQINDDEINGIIEFVMLMIIPFMSRLIDNKERESYGETMKSIESSITRAKGAGVPLLNQGAQ